MPSTPILYTSTHRIRFSELDPDNHMNTGTYGTYFVDHRMEALRESIGWDLRTLDTLPFMVWVRRVEIEFLRPVGGDQEVTITSFVHEFRGSDALIECAMRNSAGTDVSRCHMTVAYVDKATHRSAAWPPETKALFYQADSAAVANGSVALSR